MSEFDKKPEEKNPRDEQGFRENPAEQGLKTPPKIPFGEDSGEWARGGGTDTSDGPGKPPRE